MKRSFPSVAGAGEACLGLPRSENPPLEGPWGSSHDGLESGPSLTIDFVPLSLGGGPLRVARPDQSSKPPRSPRPPRPPKPPRRPSSPHGVFEAADLAKWSLDPLECGNYEPSFLDGFATPKFARAKAPVRSPTDQPENKPAAGVKDIEDSPCDEGYWPLCGSNVNCTECGKVPAQRRATF
ncbi:hypothetical protein M885DRAFT_566163 [Pelagophyceae sp. CCMP2097]|nr:hypothetical protein M885DRAFT_566163 [Pelagophyceae sp. CCMP2097]